MKKVLDIAKKVIRIFAIPAILGVATIFLHFNIEQTLLTWIILKTFIVLSLVANLFAFPALLYFLKEDLSVVESYKRAKNIVWDFLFVLVLYLTFTLGGALFLIIPGIIFAILFSLSFFALIFEEKKGISALWRSRELVKGKGWYLFSLFLVIGIIFAILQAVSNLVIESHQLSLSFALDYFLSMAYYIALWVVLFNFYEKRKKEDLATSKLRGFSKALFIIPAIPGSLLILVYFVFTFSVLFRDYDPPFDDSHLLLEEKEIKEEGNLYFFFKENKDTRLEIEDPSHHVPQEMSYYEFTKENPEKAEKIIEKNKEVYDYFDEIASYDYFSSPLEFQFVVLPPGELLSISRVVSLKGSYLLYSGETERGMDLFLENVRIGKMIADDKHPLLIDFLIGVGKQSIAYASMLPHMSEIEISLEEMQGFQEKIASAEIKKKYFSRTFSGEYTRLVNELDEEFSAEKSPFTSKEEIKIVNAFMHQTSFFFKPNETKRELASFYEPIIKKDFENVRDPEEFPLFYPSSESFVMETIKGNIVGKILNSVVIVATVPENHFNEARKISLQNRVIRTMLALNVYERKEGELPESLEELAPEYIEEVPKDPFNKNENIRYSKEERIIYSVQKEEVREGEREDYIFEF